MSLSTLGRRFERLLFFAAPLSLGSVVTLFVVFASDTQNERRTARCYESSARLFESKADRAEVIWNEFRSSKKFAAMAKVDYVFDLRNLLLDISLESGCRRMLAEEIDKRSELGPKALIDGLHKDAEKLASTPLRYQGVDIPERATIALMGTSISIELVLFSTLLQVLLGPLMLLWLGSLYTTRFRETVLIEKAKAVTDLFPHLINIYPVGRIPDVRRRNRLIPYIPKIMAITYFITRVGLLTMFVGPAVGSYIAGVVIVEPSSYSWALTILATMVGIFATALVLCELLPWHFKRMFPGPSIGER
jgi:hypothetical protein